jgi:hypothetical protein
VVAADANPDDHARRGKRAGSGQQQHGKQFAFHDSSSFNSLCSAAISRRLTPS